MSASATDVVTALAAGRKATQLYPHDHPRYVEAIDALVGAVKDNAAIAPFVLNVHDGMLYAGSDVLAEDAPALASVAEAMEARRVESLTFVNAFDTSDAESLTEVLALRPSVQLDIETELSVRGVTNVIVAKIVDENAKEKEERDRQREQDRALYRRFVSTMRDISARLQKGSDVDLTQANVLVPEILVRLLENQAAVLALATLRSHNEAELFHSINVMIYALTIGAALDLPQEGFASLGVSALVHDVGKSAFPPGPEHAEEMRQLHPQMGADLLARMKGEDRAPMLVAYEHHMGLGGAGWPEHGDDYFPHPYSRMVAIADRYETLTKSAGENALTPDKAVAKLLAEAGTMLDPIFTRMFVQALGVFPVGCWVRLSDHAVGVVCDKGAEPLKPKLTMVFDEHGAEYEEPLQVDLAEDERDIVEVLHEADLAEAAADHL